MGRLGGSQGRPEDTMRNAPTLGSPPLERARQLVMEQASCSSTFALALLEAMCAAKNITIDEFAAAVLDGEYTFAPRRFAAPSRRFARARSLVG